MIVEQCLGSHPCDRRALHPNIRLRSPGGFTLVELLVVIAIIAFEKFTASPPPAF